MLSVFRVPVLRGLLWWLADHGILRTSIEEHFKRRLLRRGDVGVEPVPFPHVAQPGTQHDPGRESTAAEG